MSDTGTPILSARGLSAWIGTHHIVREVSFDVPATGVTALLGRNGVGKTTTLRALIGLIRPTGQVCLGGETIAGLPTHEIVARGVGYVPENREIFASLTVAENLAIATRTPTPELDRVHALFPELRVRARQIAGTLSGGQQQMLAIGRALINDNRLLLIDEPTKGLAPRVVTEVAAALQVASRDTPILLVEQDLAVIAALADRVLVMVDGVLAHSGPTAQFLADPSMVTSLLGVGRRQPA